MGPCAVCNHTHATTRMQPHATSSSDACSRTYAITCMQPNAPSSSDAVHRQPSVSTCTRTGMHGSMSELNACRRMHADRRTRMQEDACRQEDDADRRMHADRRMQALCGPLDADDKEVGEPLLPTMILTNLLTYLLTTKRLVLSPSFPPRGSNRRPIRERGKASREKGRRILLLTSYLVLRTSYLLTMTRSVPSS